MKVQYSYLATQFSPDSALRRDILKDIAALMDTGDYTLGEPVRRFEQAIQEKYGVRHCIGVNSGTDALILSLKALDIGPGKVVLTQPNTFVATVGAIVAAGATPMFCDVDETYQLDLAKAEHRRVACAMPVHLTGLARKATLWPLVVNDAAQAVGAEWDGESVAKFPFVSCFSLHPLKNAHAGGDAGFITTNDAELARELRLLRNHGLISRDDVVIPGYNSRLDSIQAIFAYHSLKQIDETNERRRQNAAHYDQGLKACPGVSIPLRDPNALQVFHTYIVEVDNRGGLIDYLNQREVQVKIHYPTPLHLQPAFRYLGHRRGDFPVAERQAGRILSLPIHEFLTDAQVSYVIQCIHEFYRGQEATG